MMGTVYIQQPVILCAAAPSEEQANDLLDRFLEEHRPNWDSDEEQRVYLTTKQVEEAARS